MGDIKESPMDYQLISSLIDMTLKGNMEEMAHVDSYIIDEWALFIQSKKEIVLDMDDINDYFKTLSKLIMVDVVDTYNAMKSGKALKETDNALKTEWFALFPSLETLKIYTFGIDYAFRLDVLLKSMKEISPTLSVVIDDSFAR